MIDCNFTRNPDGLWQCPVCGWVFPLESPKPPRRNCPKPKLEPLEPLDPYPPEEAAWILTHVCGPCDKFRIQTQTCRCGSCKSGFKILDRLRAGISGCPGDRW